MLSLGEWRIFFSEKKENNARGGGAGGQKMFMYNCIVGLILHVPVLVFIYLQVYVIATTGQ